MNKRVWTVAAAIVLMAVAGTTAEEPIAAAQEQSRLTPLKLQVVLSRYDGERKVSSMPYTLWVTSSTEPNQASQLGVSLRMGIQVPIMSVVKDVTSGTSSSQVTYRDVGTNIDCQSVTIGEGQFRLGLTVVQNSIHTDDKKAPASAGAGNIASAQPILRAFTSRFTPVLRDGQTAQYMTATDPVSGEVLKIDATLNVLK